MLQLNRLATILPIVQAPMAGLSTPDLAAAVSKAGALDSIGVGAVDATGARDMIDRVRTLTHQPFNINLFVHNEGASDAGREAAWLEWLAPLFAEFEAEPPTALRGIYKSFGADADMLGMLVDRVPPVVSFHFGLPRADTLAALRHRGVVLLATGTTGKAGR